MAARQEASPAAAVQRRVALESPCDAMLGRWRFSGNVLTLGPAGQATFQPGAFRESQPTRWLCRQDGTGEVVLPEGTRRLSRQPTSDGLELSGADGPPAVAQRGD
jgi:hypothetical protein